MVLIAQGQSNELNGAGSMVLIIVALLVVATMLGRKKR